LVAAVLLGGAAAVLAQNNFDKVEITSEKLGDNVWVLYGAGGNMGLCAGPDGGVLIDDQFAPLTAKIQTAVRTASGREIKYVVNTHWHGDHAGGNANMAQAGALILAHDRVRARLVEGQDNKFFGRKIEPAPAPALPSITFNDSTTLHMNGETVSVFHVKSAHTDGDAIVWFPRANVVHMGDTFFNGLYPIIDLESGGSIDGMIAASDRVLAQVGSETRIIPGHGKVTDKAQLQKYRDMLAGVRAAVAKLVKEKKTLDQAIAAKPTTPWDAEWGNGFVKPDVFTTVVFNELSKKR
jgi:glyoxylase-like metal-dependent hydrolase (beta-lactamase superfamily II)